MPFLEGEERAWNEKCYLDETKKKKNPMGCRDAKISCIRARACTHAIREEAMVLERTDGTSSL